MSLINCSFGEFVCRLKRQDKKLICYGAGMLPLYTQQLFARERIAEHIAFFVDGNPKKSHTFFRYQEKDVPIEPPGALAQCDPDEYRILIMAEKYREILRSLEKVIDSDRWECFAYPLLNLSYFEQMKKEPLLCGHGEGIPKIIHYIWFGGGEKGALHKACIKSFWEKCPDYRIVEWNESNYDVHKNRYIHQAYENGKWAYVCDYARLDILYRNGGVYFDTDVELIKNIDCLLQTDSFICFGEWPSPNSGAGIGARAGNEIIRRMMETREHIDFLQADHSPDAYTNSNYEMQALMEYGFSMDFTCQSRHGMTIYPPDIIAPVSVTGETSYITDRTVGVHHCDNSWRG